MSENSMTQREPEEIVYSSLSEVDWTNYDQSGAREALWDYILDHQLDISLEIDAIRKMLPEHKRDEVIEAWGHPLPEVFNSGYTNDLILAKLLQNPVAINAVKAVMIKNATDWDQQSSCWVPIKNATIYLDKFEKSVDAAIVKYKGLNWSNSKQDTRYQSLPITEINPRGI